MEVEHQDGHPPPSMAQAQVQEQEQEKKTYRKGKAPLEEERKLEPLRGDQIQSKPSNP